MHGQAEADTEGMQKRERRLPIPVLQVAHMACRDIRALGEDFLRNARLGPGVRQHLGKSMNQL